MAINKRVTSYAVTRARNDLVKYRRVTRLVTDSGHRASIAFLDPQPADWLQFPVSGSNIFLPSAQFELVHRTLKSESPVFYTAFILVGPAFSLSTGAEVIGEGPGDDDAPHPYGQTGPRRSPRDSALESNPKQEVSHHVPCQ